MAVKKKVVKGKFTGKILRGKSKGSSSKKGGKKQISQLVNLTAKRLEIRYRDRKGRLVDPEKINGRKYLKWEIWRFSENTKRWKKLDFGKYWEPKERKLKRPKTKSELMKLARTRFGRHKIKVRKIKGEIYAFTESK